MSDSKICDECGGAIVENKHGWPRCAVCGAEKPRSILCLVSGEVSPTPFQLLRENAQDLRGGTMSDLKPCPFCGQVPTVEWYPMPDHPQCTEKVELACETLGCPVAPIVVRYIARLEDKSKVEAEIITQWNTRAKVAEN